MMMASATPAASGTNESVATSGAESSTMTSRRPQIIITPTIQLSSTSSEPSPLYYHQQTPSFVFEDSNQVQQQLEQQQQQQQQQQQYQRTCEVTAPVSPASSFEAASAIVQQTTHHVVDHDSLVQVQEDETDATTTTEVQNTFKFLF